MFIVLFSFSVCLEKRFSEKFKERRKMGVRRQTSLREGQAGEVVPRRPESTRPKKWSRGILVVRWAEVQAPGLRASGHVDEGDTVAS